MKIVVIDGQGGRMGSAFIDRCKKALGNKAQLIAIGTNSAATQSMLKAGADGGATGENPVIVNVKDADYVVGPIGIMAADALLGEVTPAMAAAVARCGGQKILLPVNLCNFWVAGAQSCTMGELIEDALKHILSSLQPAKN